jgi:hypothetical protein
MLTKDIGAFALLIQAFERMYHVHLSLGGDYVCPKYL